MLTPESAARKDRTTGNSATLQHRHFAFIADTLRAMHMTPLSPLHRRIVIDLFAEACAQSNPRFDRARFLKACGEEV
jgi:hypothetical protein